jgi:hypothetical protein
MSAVDRIRRASLPLLVVGLLTSSGCQSSSRSFHMDSNSRVPWFGLNLPLPQPSSRRKTLETISDTAAAAPAIELADQKSIAAPTEPNTPVRSLLPKWLGGTEASLPIPPDAPKLDPREVVALDGPREEFR